MSFENILKKLEGASREHDGLYSGMILITLLLWVVKPLVEWLSDFGESLSIKPILHFNAEGKIVVFEKVRHREENCETLGCLTEDNREMELSIPSY